MIRSTGATAGYEHGRALVNRRGEQILQLANLVATEGQSREIVANHPDRRAADRPAQPLQRLDRSRQVRQRHARDPIQARPEGVGRHHDSDSRRSRSMLTAEPVVIDCSIA